MNKTSDLVTLIEAYTRAHRTWQQIRSMYPNDNEIDLKAAALITAAWVVADALGERIFEIESGYSLPVS